MAWTRRAASAISLFSISSVLESEIVDVPELGGGVDGKDEARGRGVSVTNDMSVELEFSDKE